jgi:hypothetical protein
MKGQPDEQVHALLIMADCEVYIPINVFKDHLRSSEKLFIILLSFREVTKQRLAKFIDSFLSNIGNSFWSSISATSSNEGQKQRAIDLSNNFFLILAFPVICGLGINNKILIHLWLGTKFYISDLFTWISFSNFLIFGALSFWGWFFVGEQKIEKKTKTINLAGFINIVSSIILTKVIGVIGRVLGMFISFYFFDIWHIKSIMLKDLNINLSDFLKRFVILVGLTAIVAYFHERFHFFEVTTWTKLLLNISINYVIIVFLFIFIFFKKNDIELAKKYFKTPFRK